MEQCSIILNKMRTLRGVAQYFYSNEIRFIHAFALRENILNFKTKNPTAEEIDFILCSTGGSADFAYMIIRTLRHHFKKVNIVIPFFAKSAATLLSLGATQIIMDEFGEFGPLDVQIPREKDDNPIDSDDRESALIDEISLENIETRAHKQFHKMFHSIFEDTDIPVNKNDLTNSLLSYLSAFYVPLLNQIKTYKIGEKNRMLDIGSKYANRILLQYNKQINEERRNDLVQYLVHDCPHHGYNIDFIILKSLLPEMVVHSSEISGEYQNVLQQLSMALIRKTLNDTLPVFNNFILEQPETKKEGTLIADSNPEILAKISSKKHTNRNGEKSENKPIGA